MSMKEMPGPGDAAMIFLLNSRAENASLDHS
jgi:hypothetical protein